MLCFLCGRVQNVLKFDENKLKGCNDALKYRIVKHFKYKDVALPGDCDRPVGYHSGCWKKFLITNPKYQQEFHQFIQNNLESGAAVSSQILGENHYSQEMLDKSRDENIMSVDNNVERSTSEISKVMSTPARRFRCLTLREKVDIINAFSGGTTRKVLMERYRLPASTLCCILRRRDQLLRSLGERQVGPSTKRIRTLDSPQLEERMKSFVSDCRRDGVELTGTMILAKAKEFAVTLGLSHFRASNGWLSNFKKRNGIASRKNQIRIKLSQPEQSSKISPSVEYKSTENEQANSTVSHNPMNDEHLVAVNEIPHFEREGLKLETFDCDYVESKEFDLETEFDEATRGMKLDKADLEFVNTGGTSNARDGDEYSPGGSSKARGEDEFNAASSGAREDEFDSFGKYIASALRAMPGRMSIVARTELQNALSRVQIRCLEAD